MIRWSRTQEEALFLASLYLHSDLETQEKEAKKASFVLHCDGVYRHNTNLEYIDNNHIYVLERNIAQKALIMV